MFVPTAYWGGEAPDVYDYLFRGSWDASNSSSYPGTGANWFNVSGSGTFAESNSTFVTWTDSGSADYFSYSNNANHLIGSLGFEMIDGNPQSLTTYGNGWTISMWVRPGANGEGYFYLESFPGSSLMEIEMDYHNNRFYWIAEQEGGGGVFNGTSTNTYSTGVWYNVVFTYDGVTFKGYVNNSLRTSGAKSNPAYTTRTSMDVSLYMGYTPTYNNNTGKIGMMEMWNRAITADNVTDIWNYHKTRFGY